ncbi:MAG: hypothetical protein P1V51_08855 [Deltaproteobacteria bacterium]|nr:hypothetical protein [Deltaproteobacteria bacterium]
MKRSILFSALFALALGLTLTACPREGEGKRCDGNSECKTGTCQNNICVEDGVGAACASPDDCRSGLACNASMPEGYCTDTCASADECPSGTACVVRGGQGLCLLACSEDATCRTGYTCSGGVCDLPCTNDAECGGGEACENGRCRDSTAGKACSGDNECMIPLTCISGTCTGACTTSGDCPNGAVCGLENGDRHCVAGCRADIDCGAEELCLGGGCIDRCRSDADCGGGVCDLQTGLCSNANGVQVDVIDLGQVVQNTVYTFTVPSGTFALTIQVQGTQGREYQWMSVKKPDGTELVGASVGGVPYPLKVLPQTEVITAQIPAGDDPRLSADEGLWSFSFRGGDGAAKIWLKTSRDGQPHGGDVRLNVFLAPGAINGVDASNAASSSFLQDTLANWERFYVDQAEIGVADVSYFDIGAQWSDVEASMTGADGELNDMWRQGRNDGLNVFFVRSIGGGFGGIAGIAGGIPGPPLTGGTAHSGIAIEVQQTTQLTGIDFCHEAGHFQGLYHLSEFFGQGHDDFTDTPECSPPNGNCDGPVQHMMFPALDPRQRLVSPHSARALQSNAGVQ